MKLGNLIRTARSWFFDTPERALDQAYQCALTIKAIEDEHFQGQKVSSEFADYGDSAIAFFRAEVNQNIKTAKLRLTEFKTSNGFMRLSEKNNFNSDPDLYDIELREKPSIIVEKLNFIDSVISKYDKSLEAKKRSVSLVKFEPENTETRPSKQVVSTKNKDFLQPTESQARRITSMEAEKTAPDIATISDKTGVLPRSILRTLSRIKQDIDPESSEAEQEVLKNYRKSRNKTAISIRFLLILIIVPLLTHQITKTFIIYPIVDGYFFQEQQVLFVNSDLQEEAFMELEAFERSLHFRSLIGMIPEISPEEMEEAVREKAEEIAVHYRQIGSDGIANIFADICSLGAFAWIIYISRREIAVLKSFMDEILYGLSDSAKAFLIILFTDIFVGYHSPHGWEVILEGIAHHFGLPESRDFNFLFIATFPVILDTVLKYWIFRYLNRISPSAVATYRNMNE